MPALTFRLVIAVFGDVTLLGVCAADFEVVGGDGGVDDGDVGCDVCVCDVVGEDLALFFDGEEAREGWAESGGCVGGVGEEGLEEGAVDVGVGGVHCGARSVMATALFMGRCENCVRVFVEMVRRMRWWK